MSFHRYSDSTSGKGLGYSDIPDIPASLEAEYRNIGIHPGKPAEKLTGLAVQVSRLCPDHRDPEAFRMATLRRLARETSQ